MFENDVKMYGTQTYDGSKKSDGLFENDVKMYGTQTKLGDLEQQAQFENDVKMYGTQTCDISTAPEKRLRMM